MESRFSTHITQAEWRWVIFVATIFALLAFSPLIWVAVSGQPGWQFMGALHNYLDGATYISKMEQGFRGEWLVSFQHTPEAHQGAFLQVLYPLLGHLSRVLSLPTIIIFHVARVGAAVCMYVTLYQLGASIWMRVRARRLFFAIVSFGSGVGWIAAPLLGGKNLYPDLQIPEAYPFLSTLFNVHFPLAIACLALLVSFVMMAFRPGAELSQSSDQNAIIAGVISFLLALLYPQALVPFGAALGVYVCLLWLIQRRILPRDFRWLIAIILPAAPLAVYYFAVVESNPIFAEWNRQNVTYAPSLLTMFLGFLFPFLIGLPSLFRALRRFEQNDDRFMVLWLILILAAVYFPSNVQRRFMVGMMIPLAYFATRALEDFWFRHISRRYRGYAFAIVLPLMGVSQLFTLFLPILPAISGNPEQVVGIFLEQEYPAGAFRWLRVNTDPDDVVLASPVVGTWIPAWSAARVVYGHQYETMEAERRLQQVNDWYSGEADCAALLEEYRIRYVIVGPEERRFGDVACADSLDLVRRFGEVDIYAP